jgi:hypothetical protein
MADVIWSCPHCGADLDDDGYLFWCESCDRSFTPPAVVVPDDDG